MNGNKNSELYKYTSVEEAFVNIESLNYGKNYIVDENDNINTSHLKTVCAHLAFGKIEVNKKYSDISPKINKKLFKKYKYKKFSPKLYINQFLDGKLILQASNFNYLNEFEFVNLELLKKVNNLYYLFYDGNIEDIVIKYNGSNVELVESQKYKEFKKSVKPFDCLKSIVNEETTTYWLKNQDSRRFNDISSDGIISQDMVEKNVQKIVVSIGTELMDNNKPIEIKMLPNIKKSLTEYKNVFIFMNDPQSGGVEDQVKLYIKKYRELGVEKIYFVCRDYSEFAPEVLFDETTLNVDGIYVMSNNKELDELLSQGNNLLHFTFPMIASHFTDHFWNNAVIVQYHGNIKHIERVNEKKLIEVRNKIAVGEIQIIGDETELQNELKKLNARAISNYSTVKPIDVSNEENVKADKIKVGYVGRLKKDKNIKGLIEVISNVLDQSNEFEFHIFGDGDERYRFDIFNENVVLYGVESDKDRIYKHLDYLILPSLVESFGMVLVEALAYGVMPISMRNSDIINTIIPSKQIGCIVDNEEEMVEQILSKPSYQKSDLIEYYKNNFYEKNYRLTDTLFKINRQKNLEPGWVAVYDIKQLTTHIEIKLFVKPYVIIDISELAINKIFANGANVEIIENKDYKYYSGLAKNFVDNFITLRIDSQDIETIDYIELYYKSKRLKLVPIQARNIYPKNKLENELTINVGSKIEFIRNDVEDYMSITSSAKDIVLYQDRPLKADDNAEVMYRNTDHKQISKFFVLRPQSVDYLRLINEGFNVVEFGSKKHKQLYLKCKVLVSSHAMKKEISPIFLKERDSSNYHHIFLQHGILNETHYNFVLNPLNAAVGTFCVTNEEEHELVSNFGYSNETLLVSGLPRHDNAPKNESNTILYFPHWTHDDEEAYFNNINSLLNNSKLSELLIENNYKFKYVMHSMIEAKYNKIEIPECENIEVLTNNQINYNNLLNNIDLVITSTSSLRFDAYARKVNVVHYLPANEKVGEYFDYFDKYYTEEKLINYLEKNINKKYPLQDSAEEMFNRMFPQKGNSVSIINQRMFEVLGYVNSKQ